MELQSYLNGDIGLKKHIFEFTYHFSFIQQPDEANRPLLLPKKWHHYCVAYTESTAAFVQVLVSILRLQQQYQSQIMIICRME